MKNKKFFFNNPIYLILFLEHILDKYVISLGTCWREKSFFFPQSHAACPVFLIYCDSKEK